MNQNYEMPDKDVTEFSTRITPAQLDKIKLYAKYRGVSIQAVAIAAFDDFFDERESEMKKAAQWQKQQEKPL